MHCASAGAYFEDGKMISNAKRYAVLPSCGTLLVSGDLHGNAADFHRLREIFLNTSLEDPETYWVILGDIVHGPNEIARHERPELYDYEDSSFEIVKGVIELQNQYSGRVLYVLGNHDHGHVGGPHTHRFYNDEVTHLESVLNNKQCIKIHQLFEQALLAVVAPCGVVLCHGSPDDQLKKLEDLDEVSLNPKDNDDYQRHLLHTFLNSYGQPSPVTARFLENISTTDIRLSLVIHGHDKGEEGWFAEGGNQICIGIFGALRECKRFVKLDLASHYRSTDDIREGFEIQRLYPA